MNINEHRNMKLLSVASLCNFLLRLSYRVNLFTTGVYMSHIEKHTRNLKEGTRVKRTNLSSLRVSLSGYE